MHTHTNSIVIFYSEEDEGYITVVPELPGCSAFGETEEEALREIKVAIDLRLEVERVEKEKEVVTEWFSEDHLRLLTDIAEWRMARLAKGSKEEDEFVYDKQEVVIPLSFS
ncbi:type II toxin-antitoxin system HicB family antitoxin [Patescibacteria group bacterium]|nr:type II toxin-antitoxin system HicB family antitoxin [Patescibacteria group bacterium]